MAVQTYWQHVCHPISVAFFELPVAARTDTELEAILKPTQATFCEECDNTAIELFPEWHGNKATFDLALDLSRYLIEGLTVSALTHEKTERSKHLLVCLEETVWALRPREQRNAVPSWLAQESAALYRPSKLGACLAINAAMPLRASVVPPASPEIAAVSFSIWASSEFVKLSINSRLTSP